MDDFRSGDMYDETTSVPNGRSYSSRDRMTLLPEDFTPSEDDVICGRGKKCYAHVGNDRFRLRVIGMLGEYRKARSKLDKSKVLSDVVEQVRLNSPRGGFVKQDNSGRWFEVGDFLAREKTSQAFRDALHENYKSSNVAKKKRRQNDYSRPDKFTKLHPDTDIASRMEKLTFGLDTVGVDGRSRHLMRVPMELRPDHEYVRSYSAGYSPSRLSSGNIPVSSNLKIDELRSMDSNYNSSPFYFRDHETTLETRSDIMSRSRRRAIRSPSSRPQSYSLPCSPMNVPTVFEETAMEDLHHSVPNMHFSFGSRHEPPISETEAMHHSLPNMYFEPETDDDMEPIPFDLVLPDLSKRTSSVFASSTSSEPPLTISATLLDSLAKITESSALDDSPFEPIPLSPASKRRQSLALGKSDFPNIQVEQPLRDAFVEEN